MSTPISKELKDTGLRYCEWISRLPDRSNYIVNVGASDGITLDIMYKTFQGGSDGLCIEPNAQKFQKLKNNLPGVDCHLDYATPVNIEHIFEEYNVPEEPDAIDVDIDCYDYFVAKQILEIRKPKILSIEYNPLIRPGIEFTVMFDADHPNMQRHLTWFFGCSITQACLLQEYGYKLFCIDWVEAFFVREDVAHLYDLQSCDFWAYMNGFYNREGRDAFDHLLPFDPIAHSEEENKKLLEDLFKGNEHLYKMR